MLYIQYIKYAIYSKLTLKLTLAGQSDLANGPFYVVRQKILLNATVMQLITVAGALQNNKRSLA